MIEIHPFGVFVQASTRHLILGSFTGKEGYDWFYGTSLNQFWPILEAVYNIRLPDKKSKQDLFISLRMAIADIIYQCERHRGTNLDSNLTNIVYNFEPIGKIFAAHQIETVYFSSRFVEIRFKRHFKYPAVNLVTLPSPSPRYAALSLRAKIDLYRRLLPKL